MPSGLNKCKSCCKNQAKILYYQKIKNPDFLIKERKRGREKARKYKYKQRARVKKSAMLNYRNRYPEKVLAKSKSSHMKPIIKGNHMHHWSYNEEHYSDTIEMNPKQHLKAHRFIIYDQERKMYRAVSGELLDTKERHIEYINDKIINEED